MEIVVDWRELFGRARGVAQLAYAPYSGLQVGAAGLVVGGDGFSEVTVAGTVEEQAGGQAGGNDRHAGRIVVGCNVENASYGLTLCAECAMVSQLHSGGHIAAEGRLVAVACVDGDGNPLTPCGRCRQLLLEAGGFDLLVNEHQTIADLLPGAFTPEDLPAATVSGATATAAISATSVPSEADVVATPTASSEETARPVSHTEESPKKSFSMQDILAAKATGKRISDEEIRWFISAYTEGRIPDEQTSSLLMAIRLCGMEPEELAVWTAAMIDSGEKLNLSSLPRPTVDKHSTGGVGDKISLILAPLVATCGAAVPQLSGRGLGHTGGTLDKLESIPGWRANLSNQEMLANLTNTGAVICAAGSGLAPADRKLYALRDVTGTVESIPLIASSIMSKKIAEGTAALVLDVKVGSGAFMKDSASARQLAEAMVRIGAAHNVATSALLTNMQIPLGNTAGNAIEVQEAVEVLAGGGPADVRELTLALAQEMLSLAQLDADPEATLDSGAAMDKWNEMIKAQDGDPDAPLPAPKETEEVLATESGYLAELDALEVGLAAWRLGAGRKRKEDPVSHAAGVVWHARPGDKIDKGQKLFTLHTDDPALIPAALESLAKSHEISASPPEPSELVIDRVKQ